MIRTIHELLLQFAGLGGAEWIIIAAIIIVILFGVKKIPELARSTRDKLESIAEKLGIDSTNKSDEELRLAIDKNLSKNSD
jgi:sec-independent protein translocase protein TatA